MQTFASAYGESNEADAYESFFGGAREGAQERFPGSDYLHDGMVAILFLQNLRRPDRHHGTPPTVRPRYTSETSPSAAPAAAVSRRAIGKKESHREPVLVRTP